MHTTTSREWAECPPGRDGVELLQARFEHHVYDRHMHDAYAIGITLQGVQRFWCAGELYESVPGNVIVIRPGEVHDGRSGSHGGYAYKMIYVRPDVLDSLLDGAPFSPDEHPSGPLISDRVAFDLLNAGWNALAASPNSLASDELLVRSLGTLARWIVHPTDRRAITTTRRWLAFATTCMTAWSDR